MALAIKSSGIQAREDERVLDFVDKSGRSRCVPLADCWDVPFEDVVPVRRFSWAKSQRHWPGWWWSAKTGQHIAFESWDERDHAMLLDFQPDVVGFSSQPFWLRWPGADRPRRHAPDFFARPVDGTGVVLDVRADDRIEPSDAEAFEAMGQACAELGWEFRRLGAPDALRAANVRWLSRYRHPRCAGRAAVASRLLEVFAQPTPLFDGAAEVGDRIAVLPALYHLMWRQKLVADLMAERLCPSTMVRRAEDGGDG